MGGHVHQPAPPRLTEPMVREHLCDEHGWRRLDALLPTYFVLLAAHGREHRKERLVVAS